MKMTRTEKVLAGMFIVAVGVFTIGFFVLLGMEAWR